MTLNGRVVLETQPLLGAERDELTAMVTRLKRADERSRAAYTPKRAAPAAKPTPRDAQWAADWQLPREVFDYFVLERVS